MNLLRELYHKVKEEQAAIFSLGNHWDTVLEKFNTISFWGEVEKEILFISMIHQVQDSKTGELINLTPEMSEEFYLTGEIEGLRTCNPFAWTFWRIDMAFGFIHVYVSFNGDPYKSPRENYDLSREGVQIYKGQILEFEARIRDLGRKEQRIFRRLFEVIEHNKNNRIEEFNFHKKVFVNFVEYFGIINNKNFLLDPFKRTRKPEIVKIPQRFEAVDIGNDMKNKLGGMSFETINYETNGIVRTFRKYREMHNYLHSLITYVNKNKEQLGVCEAIESLFKTWESNRWEFPENEEEMARNRRDLRRYDVAATRFDDKIAVRAAVQEFGICWQLTNFPDGPSPWTP